MFGLKKLNKRLEEEAALTKQPLQADIYQDQIWLVYGDGDLIVTDFMDDDDGREHFTVSLFGSPESALHFAETSPQGGGGEHFRFRLLPTGILGMFFFLEHIAQAVEALSASQLFREHKASLEAGRIWVVVDPVWKGTNTWGLHVPLEEILKIWEPEGNEALSKGFHEGLAELFK